MTDRETAALMYFIVTLLLFSKRNLSRGIMNLSVCLFQKEHPLTAKERRLLLCWICIGNDVISNLWNYEFDDGWEMVFIYVLRLGEVTYETIKRIAEES